MFLWGLFLYFCKMRLKLKWVFLCVVFHVSSVVGQNKNSLIVQVANKDVARFYELNNYNKIIINPIAENWGVYKVYIDSKRIDKAADLSEISWLKKELPNSLVQLDNKIQKRVGANDPLFTSQPYLEQIQSHLVWDHTKGGVTRNGDTIVIAIIDDGLDSAHVDFKNNHWRNHIEIPWNGKDDDGNGYVDDYWGWNAGDNHGQVFNSVSILDGHGTCVAGVVGADGNNGVGISSINWNVKVLPINCFPEDFNDVESGVIRSMKYVFDMKKLYIKSNGSKGANIVAVNMSVGMDNAFPSESPIWCGLYDSLGSVGVIGVSAVTNRNIDVDKLGDIPTLCPSRFLVTVNLCDINDQFASSGYSSTSVDLSAPGNGLYTTIPTSFNTTFPYKKESGTSFASPQVASSIALIESIVCKKYLNLKKTNIDSALNLMLSWLKAGVKSSSDLSDKTAWSGRLDVYLFFDQMRQWCESNDSDFVLGRIIDSKNNEIKVYPNPVEGSSKIFMNYYSVKEDTHIAITDASGRRIDANIEYLENNLLAIHSDLRAGIYFIRVEVDGGKTFVQKIISK